MKNWIITALAVGLAIIGTLAVVSAQRSTTDVDIRVWESVDEPERNFVSARPEGGSWADLGTVPVYLDGLAPYRYGDIKLVTGVGTVEIRVWERSDNPERNFVSARVEGGSWADLGTIPLGEGKATPYQTTSNGRFRYSDITLTVRASATSTPTPTPTPSATPTPTPTPTPSATPTPTPTPSASDLAESCSFEDSLPRVRAATVQVTGSSSRNFSTAFHIGNGEFVTTAHSVTMGERVTLTADGGYRTYAVVVERGDYEDRLRSWAEVGEDVALLHASAIPSAALDWAISGEGDDWSGDPVAVVGYSWGSVQRTARGTIQGIHGDGRAINVIITSEREPAPGNSGSPIVDACGAVRGMVSSGQRTSDADDAPATASGPRSTALVARLALDGEPRENAMLARRAAVPAPIPTAVPESGAGGGGAPAGGGGGAGTHPPAETPTPAKPAGPTLAELEMALYLDYITRRAPLVQQYQAGEVAIRNGTATLNDCSARIAAMTAPHQIWQRGVLIQQCDRIAVSLQNLLNAQSNLGNSISELDAAYERTLAALREAYQ